MFIDICKNIEIMLSDKETEALETVIEVLQNIQTEAFFMDEDTMQSGKNQLTHEDFDSVLNVLHLIKDENRWYLEEQKGMVKL